MRIFFASIATETNTFVSIPTGLEAFGGEAIFAAPAGPLVRESNPYLDCLNALAEAEGHEIVPGLAVEAQPRGITAGAVYERLRDHVLGQLRAAMPVGAVILPLHGAMVADGYPDCEGDIIARVRDIVGPEVAIGVELDLHCHLTAQMRSSADVIVTYKEYPHTDVIDRLREVWRLTIDTAEGRIRPVMAIADCRMVSFWHTSREPMIGFVHRMQALESRDGILSVSFGHGFPYGDTVDSGARTLVVSDARVDPEGHKAQEVAEMLAREIWVMREETRLRMLGLDEALEKLTGAPPGRPVVLADNADNPGGGAPGDSTFFLRALCERGIGNVVIGGFYDIGAIQICREAGVGARLDLRLGGKIGPSSGEPLDLSVTVRAIRESHSQSALDFVLDCGPSVWVSTDDGIDILLISIRQQVLARDIFTGIGISLEDKRAIVVKSSQHFYAEFAPIAAEVLYVDTPGQNRLDFERLDYRHRSLRYWPRDEDPWAGSRA